MSKSYITNVKAILSRVAQAARLMVGVGDYTYYCEHMRTHHPEAHVMSEVEYFRHGQESRYPAKDGSVKRCPC